jgi:hypothetical protein
MKTSWGAWRRGLWTLLVMTWGLGLAPACRDDVDRPEPVSGDPLARAFEHGTLLEQVSPRVGYGGLKLRLAGARSYALEITRDAASVESRRFVASAAHGGVLWRLTERPQEHFTDFTVHPSGELTLGVERTGDERDTFELVRLTADGEVLARQRLPAPSTLPASDWGSNPPASPFLMKAEPAGSHVGKWLPWLRLEARGEDLAVAFLSYVEVSGGAGNKGLASGVMALQWSGGRYAEQWTRVVDGLHSLIQVAWQYDEFHWLDAATQLLLAVSPEGRVMAGRALSYGRCASVSQAFQEISLTECRILSQRNSPYRYQPFAFTSFSPEGAREGTRLFAPEGMEEFVVFDMAVRGDEVGIAGTAVRLREDGSVAYYPATPGAPSIMLPYDGYVAVLDRGTGTPRSEVFVDQGRAEYFAALRWTEEGLLAAGAAGWDRWNGGMSVSRGAEPLLALVPGDGGAVRVRSGELGGGDRHFHLLTVDALDGAVVAAGVADAPMTHSGDGAGAEQMTFGGLRVDLR